VAVHIHDTVFQRLAWQRNNESNHEEDLWMLQGKEQSEFLPNWLDVWQLQRDLWMLRDEGL
jgi:hypothetical protein